MIMLVFRRSPSADTMACFSLERARAESSSPNAAADDVQVNINDIPSKFPVGAESSAAFACSLAEASLSGGVCSCPVSCSVESDGESVSVPSTPEPVSEPPDKLTGEQDTSARLSTSVSNIVNIRFNQFSSRRGGASVRSI